MLDASSSPLHRQIARVSRRLFLQTLVNGLVWCWAGALVLSAAWFLLQPLVVAAPPEWLRWTVAGGLLVGGAGLAVGLAILRAPSRLAAALLFDEKFGLKERVTTSLGLAPREVDTPAGQALLADVNERVAALDIGSRFPVRVSWSAALVPVCAGVLAVVALFYEPPTGQANSTASKEETTAALPKAAQDQLNQEIKKLERKVRQPQKGDEPKSEKLQQLEEELERLANKPHNTRDDVKDRLEEVSKLEDEMKKEEKALADKDQAIKEQLKQMDRLAKRPKQENAPANELDKAVAEGDFNKAKEEADRLAKKLKDKELTEREKEQLKEQLGDLQDRLERLSRQQYEKDRLDELAKKGELDQDALDRELDRLMEKQEKLKALEDLAQEIGKCENGMKEGDSDKAAEALKKAAAKMKKLDKQGQDLKDLQQELQQVAEVKKSMCQGLDSKQASPPGNNPAQGAGRRPEAKSGDFQAKEVKLNPGFDPKGQKEVSGYAPGRNFKKKTSVEIAEEVKQASQEAPEAIERQRIPKAASDMAKGYFQNLGGQKTQEPKKEQSP